MPKKPAPTKKPTPTTNGVSAPSSRAIPEHWVNVVTEVKRVARGQLIVVEFEGTGFGHRAAPTEGLMVTTKSGATFFLPSVELLRA